MHPANGTPSYLGQLTNAPRRLAFKNCSKVYSKLFPDIEETRPAHRITLHSFEEFHPAVPPKRAEYTECIKKFDDSNNLHVPSKPHRVSSGSSIYAFMTLPQLDLLGRPLIKEPNPPLEEWLFPRIKHTVYLFDIFEGEAQFREGTILAGQQSTIYIKMNSRARA